MSVDFARTRNLGLGVNRVDGPLKVRGAAPYPNDVTYPDLAYAALVRATIAAGKVTRVNAGAAQAAPGVLTVITHENAPNLKRGPATLLGPSPQTPLQDDRVLHYGQYLAVVVAETPQQAAAAARLVTADYEPDEAMLEVGHPNSERRENPWGLDRQRGDVDAALGTADVLFDGTYTTPVNTNNPIGLFTTVAAWDGDTVRVHDATQWTKSVQATIAAIFNLPETAVRVQAPYLGGAFGAGLRVWPHVILAILAARTVSRPVKLVLTRPQMFTGIGYRPSTEQVVTLGATRDGTIVALEHRATIAIGMEDEFPEPVTLGSAASYAAPNARVGDVEQRLNIPPPGSLRAPGEAEGNFALESAMDELAYQLAVDPVELRLRNYAEVDPDTGLPWSSKGLRDCLTVGAERFGWSKRDPKVGSMSDGTWKIGYGVAQLSYAWWQVRCEARATISRDGTAFVRSAANDIGTGTRTVMTQLSADMLGLDLARVRFDLGDSSFPWSPGAGGSGLTTSVGAAVHAACRALLQAFLDTVAEDDHSPLAGCTLADVSVTEGRIHRADDLSAGERYSDILARHHLDDLTADGEATPRDPTELGVAPSGPFAAKFVEVRIDADLGLLRVARVVTAVDGGRILNEKLARSQIIGGTIGGIGQAIFEETITDAGTGRIANATLGDYLIPVNADIPDIDVVFVGKPDPLNPIGTKGVGEIGLPGMAAAIANAVYHATGRRIRSLPITLDQLI
jgi:CO/xanthine dehydrogenase Mo-binding subunit